jgi:hypothetical protein
MIRPIVRVAGVVVIAEEWPCWLPVLLDLGVVVDRVYAPVVYESVFRKGDQHSLRWSPFHEMKELEVVPAAWNQYNLFASGAFKFCREMVDKLRHHVGPYLYAIDMNFRITPPRKVNDNLRDYPTQLRKVGLMASKVVHAEFGGVTTARHIIAHRNVVGTGVFEAPRMLDRVLSHVISPTIAGCEIAAPLPLPKSSLRRGSIRDGDLFRGEGL